MSNARLPRRIEDYAAVVFDCDGVVLASNELKAEMLGRALEGESPEMVEAFVNYYKENAGTSRYRLYDHYFKVMRAVEDPDPKIEKTVARYASLLRGGLRRVPVMAGIETLLKRLRKHGVPCYINSGSDGQELREVFAERELAGYFADIFGSPRSKIENLALIESIAEGAPGLVLGDARSDMNAAETYNLDFVFVSGSSDWTGGVDYCIAAGIPVIETPGDIAEIEPIRTT